MEQVRRRREAKMVSRTTWRAGVIGVIALLVALLVLTLGPAAGAAVAPQAAKARTATTVSLGTKDFTEEFVLGQLYKQALEHKGITVDYHENIGSTEVIQTALRSGKINAYPEYVGEIVQTAYHVTTHPKTAHAWWALAKSLLAKDGFALTNPTPFYDVDAIAVRKADAKKYHLKTLFDMRRLQNSKQRPKNVSLALGLTYKALDQKKVFCVNVFSTDAQLAGGKYTVLKDPKLIFGVQNVAVILNKNVASPQVLSILNKVSSKLSQAAILAMNKATQLNKQSPAKVADKFLRANGLK